MYDRRAKQASYGIREFRRPVVGRGLREAVGLADRTKIESLQKNRQRMKYSDSIFRIWHLNYHKNELKSNQITLKESSQNGVLKFHFQKMALKLS